MEQLAREPILLIVEGWYTGGTEQYVASLARYLVRTGRFEVHLALLHGWQEDQLAEARQSADQVHLLGGRFPGALWKLGRLVRRLGPRVCHCHLYASLLPVTALLRAFCVPRLVATLHMPLSAWGFRHRWMWRAAIGLTDQVAGVSQSVVRSLPASVRACGGRVQVIPPPVAEFSRTASTTRVAGYASGRPFTVVGCGRLSREKDWPTLVRAFGRLAAFAGSSVRLLLVGDGPLDGELRRLVRQLGLAELVEMPGRLGRAQTLDRMALGDVFVLPSHFEGLGIAALEAMLLGVPTITADFEASLDFVTHGVTGHRFPRGDDWQLGQLLLWHHDHRDESREIGECGRHYVLEHFSESRTFARYCVLYVGDALPRQGDQEAIWTPRCLESEVWR